MFRKLKLKLPFQWRLFLPLVIFLWVLLLGLAYWQTDREMKYKEAFVGQQLRMINSRVERAILNNNWTGLDTFKKFVREFYDSDSLFNDVRITVFDQDWVVTDTLGDHIRLTRQEKIELDDDLIQRDPLPTAVQLSDDIPHFYYGSRLNTNDNSYLIVSALPNDSNMERYIAGDAFETWAVIFIIAVVITLITYVAVKKLSKSIRLLRDFANRTATDPWFVPGEEFAHDEMGDIARQIVTLYNERAAARERTEREHQMALHSIEERARQKRQLTNNINHELKTPIGVIKGYLDTILDSPDMDEETRRHFLSKARDHANRLVNLMADVSAITRLEEGEDQINTEQLDFHELVYIFSNDARESGMLGHFKMEIDLPLAADIKGNTNLLVGMLMNLTKNAVNYSEGDTVTVEYRGEDDQYYTFAFYDNGTGVPESSIEHLFDRFYRIDGGRARKSGGTGLGLAIVFNTIKAHGGVITARNRAKGGLEFEFTLRKWHKT